MTTDTRASLESLLGEVSQLRGLSGREELVRRHLAKFLKGRVDELYADTMGNLFAIRHGSSGAPRVMVAAHMDEVGLIVTHHEKSGLLRVAASGGLDPRVLPGRPVLVGDAAIPGVIGYKPIHLARSELDKVTAIRDLYVDIGASSQSEAEKHAPRGAMVTFVGEFAEFGDGLLRGKAFDDRGGCAQLAHLLLRQRDVTVLGAFTVQEEIGLRGANVAVHRLDPDLALVLEVTICADLPGSDASTEVTRLGAGPALSLMDRTSLADPRLNQSLIAVADRLKLPWQWRRGLGGGNDAGAIHTARGGVPSATISLPGRYIHSPTSVISRDDLWHAYQLADGWLDDAAKLKEAIA